MSKSPFALPLAVALVALVVLIVGSLRREGGRTSSEPSVVRAAPGGPGVEAGASAMDVARRGVPVFEGFADWQEAYRRASADERRTLVPRGVALATARRAAMKELIRSDPQRALAGQVPYEVRRELPREVAALLEEPVRATGDLEVLIFCGLDRSDVSRTEHLAVLPDGRSLRAFPFGRRLDLTTKHGIALHGIAIDDLMAFADDPVRVIPEGERLARGLAPDLVEVGARIYRVEDEAAVARLRDTLRGDERTLGPRHTTNYDALRAGRLDGVVAMSPDGEEELPPAESVPPPPPSAHTEGPKTMLYIRARFADQDPGFDPIALSTLETRQGACEQFWIDNSYGKSSLTTTITDTVTLGIDAPTSSENKPSFGTMLSEARSAALAANPAWNHTQFDFYTVLTQGGSGWGYGGVASVGGSGSHLNGSGAANVRTASHEFGHNLGLRHANYWRTDSPSPIGRDGVPGYRGDNTNDERVEYGHKFSVMSAQGNGGDFGELRGHYTAGEKVKLDWLELGDGDWTSVTGSGVFRVYQHDLPEADHAGMGPGLPRAIKINLDSDDYVSSSNSRRYWLTYRRLPTNGIAESWLPYGLQVDWQRNSYGSDGAIQLDMTPFSRDSTTEGGNWTTDNNDKEDAVLVIGRTYTDAAEDIHFTPTSQGGRGSNRWIEVQVHVGTQGANSEPSITSFTASATEVGTGVDVDFTMAATDPDGDPLAYSWDFADNSLVAGALNAPAATKSWGSTGQYVVRATVSDTKGGTDTRDMLITVGNPSNANFITGRILRSGVPVEGARVSIGSDYQTWTEGDGTYTLAGLPLGDHTVTAAKHGLTLTPRFTNPVDLTDLNAFGKDFDADESLGGGGGTTIAVRPYEIEIPQGATLQFTADGWNASGNPVTVNPQWSVDGGGTIDAAGVFSAVYGGGPFTVTATDGPASATASVTVTGEAGIRVVVTDGQASEAGPDSGTVRIERLGDPGEALTALISIGGTATEGDDFAAISTAVPLATGVTFADVPVVPIDDFGAEGDETVVITLQPDPSYTILDGQSSGTVTIADDGDQGPVASILSPTASPVVVPPGTGLLLTGTATDDGLPDPPGVVAARWSMLSAPAGGSVAFLPPGDFETVATFNLPGEYVLRFTATDGPNTDFAEVVVLAGIAAATNPSADDEDIYFDFNEGSGTTATDLRGGDDPGTLVNGATWSGAGVTGSALQLDGDDDQVDIADSSAVNLGTQDLRTVAFWFRADDPNRAGKQVLYEEGGTSRGLNVYLEAGLLYVGGWNNGENGWAETFLSTPLTDSGWHHVALVLDAPGSGLQTDALTAYLDGLVFARGDGAELNEHAGDIAIGARRDGTRYHDSSPSGSGDRFGGLVDEFHLWNRALTGPEITQLSVWLAPAAPQLGVANVVTGPGSVVIPTGVGVVLDGTVSGGGPAMWQEVEAPAGGAVTFGNSSAAGTTARFSAPGFYTFRLHSGPPEAAAAVPVHVHAGIDTPANPTTAGEVIRYAFDEGSGTTAADAVGGDNNGTLAGGTGWNPAGLSGSAVVFDGIDGVLEIANAAELNSGAEFNRKTIALWFRAVTAGAGGREVLYEQGDGTRGLGIYLDGGLVRGGGWNAGQNGWETTFLAAPVTAGQWHHVALVLDVPDDGTLVADGLRLILDGAPVAFGEAAEMGSHPGGIGLGAMRDGSRFPNGDAAGDGLHFAGEIDAFHHFDGRVLTIDEIGRLYAFGNIGASVDAGPDGSAVPGPGFGLSGSSSDDGRWAGTVAHTWSVTSGPGSVVFGNPDPAGIDTEAIFSAEGAHVLRLAADDGQVTTFDEVTIDVNASYYAVWVAGFPGFDGPDAEYLANPDGDDLVNAVEYAFGSDPTRVEATTGRLPAARLVREGGADYVEVTYLRRRDAWFRGLVYTPERATDPAAGPWVTTGISEQGTDVVDDDFEVVTVRITDPVSATNRMGFVRVAIEITE